MTKFMTALGSHISTAKGWEGGQAPSSNAVRKMAEYFNVSAGYLLGMTDVPTAIKDAYEDEDIIVLLRIRANMTNADKKRMMDMLRIAFQHAFGDGINEGANPCAE